MSNETLGGTVPESEMPQTAQAPEGSGEDSGRDDIKPVAWYWNTADWKGVSFGVDAAPDGVEPQPLYPAAAIEALRADNNRLRASLWSIAEWIDAGCEPKQAAHEARAALAAQEAERAPGSPGEPKTSV